MKIISTNIAESTKFIWNGKEVITGIYKKPIDKPLYLNKNDVVGDQISDRLNHGGYYKACYIYSAEQYPYWKALYPDLGWSWGMFGENLTVANFDETKVFVGDVYSVGEALVQVSEYRQPCYKLGYKFGTQKMVKQFIEHGRGGTYLSVLEEGHVKVGDTFTLVKRLEESLTVIELYDLYFSKDKDQKLLAIAANSKVIDMKKRENFKSFL